MKRLNRLFATLLLSVCAVMTPAHADTYAQTKYPIVLVHGMAGASKFFGLVDYFYGMPADLRRHGANLYVADLSAFNDTYVRGEQLAAQVRTVLATTGAKKVNLIAHSQGGFDSRYVATIMPEAVASITTIDTPHRGSQFADFLKEIPEGPKAIATSGVDLIGKMLSWFNGKDNQNSAKLLEFLAGDGANRFNAAYPSAGLNGACGTGASSETRQGNVQNLYSWTGKGNFTNLFDIADPFFVAAGIVMRARGSGDNDGVVSVCSANFGKVIANNYNWNHIDAHNQVLGLIDPFTTNPKAAVRNHANRLKMAGL